MSLLNILERNVAPDITVLELSGRLALEHESQRIETRVDELAKSGPLKLVLDLTGVDYIDSAGAGMIAMMAGKLNEEGGSIAVVAPEGRVLQLLKLTGMSGILQVHATVHAAAAAV